MRSIERRFRYCQERHPQYGTFVNFAKATRRQGFTLEMIARHFNRLVDKDDYDNDPAVKKALIAQLYGMSKPREDDEKSTKKHLMPGSIPQA